MRSTAKAHGLGEIAPFEPRLAAWVSVIDLYTSLTYNHQRDLHRYSVVKSRGRFNILSQPIRSK